MILFFLLIVISKAQNNHEQSEIDWSTCNQFEQCYALGSCFSNDNMHTHDYKNYLVSVDQASLLKTGKCEVGVHVKMFSKEFMHIQVQFSNEKFNASSDFSEVMFHFGEIKLFGCSKIGHEVTIIGDGNLVSDHMIELFEGQTRDLSFCSFTVRRVTALKDWIIREEGHHQFTTVHYVTKHDSKTISYANNDVIMRNDWYNNRDATHCDPTSIEDTLAYSPYLSNLEYGGTPMSLQIAPINGKNRNMLTCANKYQHFGYIKDGHSLKIAPVFGDLVRIECDRKNHLWKLVKTDGSTELLISPKRYTIYCQKPKSELCKTVPKCSTELGPNVICPIYTDQSKLSEDPILTCDYDNPSYQAGDEKVLMIDNIGIEERIQLEIELDKKKTYSNKQHSVYEEAPMPNQFSCKSNAVNSKLTYGGNLYVDLEARVHCNTGKYDCRYKSKLIYSDRDSCKKTCGKCNSSQFGKLSITEEKLTCEDQANYDLRAVSLNGDILSADEYSCDIQSGLWKDKDGKNISERAQVMCLPKITPHKSTV